MNSVTKELRIIIADYSARMRAIAKDEFIDKPYPNKWSKIEILGHLVDSAQNNIRRFIVSQYETSPFIIYNQDKWVAIADYQHASVNDMIDLWTLLNKQICNILDNTPPDAAKRTCETNNGNLYTIEWLAEDYIKHLLHHLHQLLQLEAVD